MTVYTIETIADFLSVPCCDHGAERIFVKGTGMETENVKNENYVTIQGWMLKDLELKGNDLLVYAIIFGFTQMRGNWFCEGLQYLADWTCSTKNGVFKNIQNLLQEGLIEKDTTDPQHPRYRITEKRSKDRTQEIAGEPPVEKRARVQTIDKVREIVEYLNAVTGRDFKATTEKTKCCINARLNEGFTVGDFKTVIDKKYAAWGQDEKMNIYLRPETLFGNKFEGYLQEDATVRLKGNRNRESGYQKIQRLMQEGEFDE